MDLTAVVKKYLELTGGFDRPLHLSRFGLPRAKVEQLFSAWDEDYQISRFMLLSRSRDDELAVYPQDTRLFSINEYQYTHVTFRPGIQQLIWAI